MESISRRVAFLREAEAGGTRAPRHVEGELGGVAFGGAGGAGEDGRGEGAGGSREGA